MDIRDFDDAHLEQAVRLWEDPSASTLRPVFGLGEVLGAVSGGDPALVAVAPQDGRVVGAIAAWVERERAWVTRWTVAHEVQRQGLGSMLLQTLERRVRAMGVRQLAILTPEGSTVSSLLRRLGYEERSGVTLFEKRQHGRDANDHLDELGARQIPPSYWTTIGGMTREKDLIERRIILPLREQELARAHGVVPASAVILFGPPGTGKTTFAKAIAARLGWPFLEIFSSQLTADHGQGRARYLRSMFERFNFLDRVVVFIDEVDDIASNRRTNTENVAVANELLKVIPDFRECEGRLLICATNSVRDLDPAFTRPGRFDYIIPVSPPDRDARRAIWESYARTVPQADVDVEELVERSEYFTPADIEYAFRLGCQAAFQRSLGGDASGCTTTADHLTAIQTMRPSLSASTLTAFEEDIRTFARF